MTRNFGHVGPFSPNYHQKWPNEFKQMEINFIIILDREVDNDKTTSLDNTNR